MYFKSMIPYLCMLTYSTRFFCFRQLIFNPGLSLDLPNGKLKFYYLQVVHVEVVAVVEDPDAVEDARRGPVVKADAAPVEHVIEHTADNNVI